jgi:hypothetical protein
MLAISVQGLLFSMSQAIGGVSLPAHMGGVWLILSWALCQPLLLGWLLNGQSFFRALKWAIDRWDPQHGSLWVALGVGALFAVSALLTTLTARMSGQHWEQWQSRVAGFSKRTQARGRKTRIPWLMIFSVGLTATFLYFTESPQARSVWIWLRPLGVSFTLYFGVSLLPLPKLIAWSKQKWPALGETLERVYASGLNQFRSNADPDLPASTATAHNAKRTTRSTTADTAAEPRHPNNT